MSWILSNWYLIVIGLALIAALVVATIRFMRQPSSTQVNNIKEWLKYAVVEAESMFGSKTGQLKLRFVYSMAVERFPWIAMYVPFEKFSNWVDIALEWMNIQLSENKAVEMYIHG